MGNRNYLRGVKMEREEVNFERKMGNISARSAGSHSPIDTWTWDKNKKEIRLCQFKVHKTHKQKIPLIIRSSDPGYTVVFEEKHYYKYVRKKTNKK